MGENIRLTAADGFELGAYRARPDGAVKGGVVVVQEIFGVNVHIRSVCDRYAEAGYLAVAPAIYDRIEPDVQIGYEPDDIARGRDIRAKADMANVIADVAAAADAAAEGGKVGIDVSARSFTGFTALFECVKELVAVVSTVAAADVHAAGTVEASAAASHGKASGTM